MGMSGGVDSAVTAYLLKAAGFEVIGITLKSWESGSSKCCEIDEAARTADILGIAYYPWNTVACFHLWRIMKRGARLTLAWNATAM